MITSAKIQHYRNASFLSFLSNVVSICNKFDTEALKIKPVVTTLATGVHSLELVFSASRKSNNTQTLTALDARRDIATFSVQSIAEVYTKHFDKDYQEAAKTIVGIFAKYGKRIDKQTYREQTSTTQSLLHDFENSTLVMAALSKLHLSDWVQELKQANEEFNQVFLQRNQELAEQPEQSFSTLRVASTEHYHKLIEILKAFDVINPNGEYERLLKELNELILKYNM